LIRAFPNYLHECVAIVCDTSGTNLERIARDCPLIDSFSRGNRLRSLLMDEKRELRRCDSLCNVLSHNIKFMQINFSKFLKADLHDFPRRVTNTTISRDRPYASSDKSQKVLNKGCYLSRGLRESTLGFSRQHVSLANAAPANGQPAFFLYIPPFYRLSFSSFSSFLFPFHPRVLLARFSCGVYTNSKG